jgi:hypothetical protein
MQGLQNVNDETWAVAKRTWCNEREPTIRNSRSSMASEMILMRNEMEKMRTEHMQQSENQLVLLESIFAEVKKLKLQPQPEIPNDDSDDNDEEDDDNDEAPPPPVTPPLPPVPPLALPRRQVAIALRRTTLMPNVPVKMPLSVSTFMSQFEASKLADWNLPSVVRQNWPPPLRNRFSRWMYLYAQVMAKASRVRKGSDHATAIRKAITAMDAEMAVLGKSNTSQYMKHLKSIDPTTKKRVKRSEL